MKTKLKVIKIRDDIYHAQIFVISRSTADQLKKYFKNKYKIEYKHDTGLCAFHYTIDNNILDFHHNYIIFPDFKNTPSGIGILNHELLHLVHDVMQIAGVKYSDDSEEAYTYYFDYLTEKILNKLV